MERFTSGGIGALARVQRDSWVDGLLAMNCVMPVQFHERRSNRSGEERLLLAVLKDAIDAFLGEEPQASKEAARWLKDTRCRHPFSFQNICDIFGLDSGWLRQGLFRQRASLAEARSLVVAPAASNEQMSPHVSEVFAGSSDLQRPAYGNGD
jgi:hypothetical protein